MRVKPVPTKGRSDSSKDKKLLGSRGLSASLFSTGSSTFVVSSRQQLYQHLLQETHLSTGKAMTSVNNVTSTSKQTNHQLPCSKNTKDAKKSALDSKPHQLLKIEVATKKYSPKSQVDHSPGNGIPIKDEMEDKVKAFSFAKAEAITLKSASNKNVSSNKGAEDKSHGKQSAKSDTAKGSSKSNKQQVDSATKSNLCKKSTQSKTSKCAIMASCGESVKKVALKTTSDKQNIEKLPLKKEPKEKPVKSKIKPMASSEKGKPKTIVPVKEMNKAINQSAGKSKNVLKKVKKIKSEPNLQLSANYNKNRRVHRMASLNALAKVHILYENESRGSPSDGSETEICTVDTLTDASMDLPTVSNCESRKRSNSETSSSTSKTICLKTEKSQDFIPKIKKSKKEFVGHSSSCSSSGSESKNDYVKPKVKKLLQNNSKTSQRSSSPQRTKNNKGKKKELAQKKHRKRKALSDVEIIDTKTCKRLACLNAQAILAASYSPERSRKVQKSLASCKVDEITTFNQKEIMTYNHEIVTDQSITTQVTNQTCTTFIHQKQQQKPSATSTTLAKQSTTSLHNVIKKSTSGSSVAKRAIDETHLSAVKSDPGIPSTTVAEAKAAQQHVCKVRTLCATSQESREKVETNSDTVRKVGVTAEYTEVTKVHINTTKEMKLKEELGKAKRRRTIERITEKDDVAITRMYRYQTKGTSQSYCVKMHTTFKPGNGNKGLVSDQPVPIAHQNKSGPLVEGVVHSDGHPTSFYNYNPHHSVVPSGHNFPLNHHQPHNASVGRVNGVPVVSVSPMVRHYGGSAFSVPHYGSANPTPPTHSQHTSLPYNQMDYGYYASPPSAAPAHDPQCLIHKPVPYHPQQSPTHQPQLHSQPNGNQSGPIHPPHAHQISPSPTCIPPNLPPNPPPAHSSYSLPASQDPYLMTSRGNSCIGVDRISPHGIYHSQATVSPHHHQVHSCQPLSEGGHSPSQRAPSAHQYHYHHQRSPVRINPPVSYSPSLNASNSANVSPSPVYHCQNRSGQQQRCIYSPPLSHSSNFGNLPSQGTTQQEYSTGPTYTVLSPVPMGASQTPQQRLISQQVKNMVGGSRNAQAIPKTEPITPPEVITLDSPDGFSAGINDSYYNHSSYPTDMSLLKCKPVSESPVIVLEVGNNPPLPLTTNVVKDISSSSRERNSSRQNLPKDHGKISNKEGPAWNLRANQAQIAQGNDQRTVPVDESVENVSLSRSIIPSTEKNIVRENGRRLRGASETSSQSVRLGSASIQRRKLGNENENLQQASTSPVVLGKKIVQADKKVTLKSVIIKEKSSNEEDSSSDITILSTQVRSTKKVKRNGSNERRNGSSETQDVVKCEENDDRSKAKSAELSLSPFNSMLIKKKLGPKKFSNGWSWEGEPFEKLVFLSNDDPPCLRRCYPAMRHIEGDLVKIRDCVLLKSGPRKIDLPFVAKVAALWETPEDGEMMISLLWYYRPEHTEQGRRPADLEDEIFASKHRDVNSVACIEDKCYVLTFSEYCRYRSRLRMFEDNYQPSTSVVPQPDDGYGRRIRLPPGRVSPEMVFVCRKVYDFRQKRLLKNPL